MRCEKKVADRQPMTAGGRLTYYEILITAYDACVASEVWRYGARRVAQKPLCSGGVPEPVLVVSIWKACGL